MATTKYWKVWSLDILGNPEEGYEFNDRFPLTCFECQLDESLSDEDAIKQVLSELERQDDDFFFLKVLGKTIYAKWEDENNIYIYKKDDDKPLYQIENLTAL